MSLLDAMARATRSHDDAMGADYGFHSGIVTNIDDPKSLGRIKARHGAMVDADSDWLMPVWPGAIEGVPRAGDPVIVGFLDGNPNRGFYLTTATTKSEKRPTEPQVLGLALVAMYNDLAAKFNALQANYQAMYTFTQGHVHAAFATPSASLLEAVIGATAHNTGVDTGKGQTSSKETVGASASTAVVLSGEAKVR